MSKNICQLQPKVGALYDPNKEPKYHSFITYTLIYNTPTPYSREISHNNAKYIPSENFRKFIVLNEILDLQW